MKKICLLVLLGFISTAHAAESPCQEIVGKWKGNLITKNCTWNLKMVGTRYGDRIRLEAQLKYVKGEICQRKVQLVISGTCDDGRIDAVVDGQYRLTGWSYSNTIDLFNSDVNVNILAHKE